MSYDECYFVGNFFYLSFTKYICTQNLGDTNIIARDHQNSNKSYLKNRRGPF